MTPPLSRIDNNPQFNQAILGGQLPERPLKRTWRNEVLAVIQETGMIPSDFEWWKVNSLVGYSSIVPAIVHLPTDSFFAFDGASGAHEPNDASFHCAFAPGIKAPIEKRELGQWDEQLQACKAWLGRVRREASAPDLWAAVQGEQTLIGAAVGEPDSDFTEAEAEKLGAAIAEIERYLTSIVGQNQQSLDFIHSRFQYLESAVARQSRQQWLHTSIGVLTTIIIGAGLAPDEARELFRFAGQQISSALQLAVENLGQILAR